MTTPVWITLSLLALLAWAFLVRWFDRNPRAGDLGTGMLYRLLQGYSYLFHRMRVEGRENIAGVLAAKPGPLIVVANHTAGVDPVLIQCALHFEVRWMMARDMMHPALNPVWEWAGVIAVERGGRDSGSARDAIRYVRAGGALGIFPEGGIERPARTLKPFLPGVGFIIAKTGAPVLPIIIEGIPERPTAWQSLYTRGHARLRFLPLRTYHGRPDEVTAAVLRDFREATGWPVSDEN